MDQVVTASALQRALLTGALAPLAGAPADSRIAIRGRFDPIRVDEAWRHVVAAHPLLRASVTPEQSFRIDGTTALARLRRDEQAISIDVHLAIADYAAACRIVTDLFRAYDGIALDPPRVVAAEDPVPSATDREFWAAHVRRFRHPEWPVVDDIWSRRFVDLRLRTLHVPRTTWPGFVANARHHGVGVGTACLALVAELLHFWSRGGCVALSTLQGRRDDRHHGMVGNFAAPLWLPFERAEWDRAPTFAAKCALTRATVKACARHGAVTTLDLVSELSKQHGLRSLPLPVVVHKSHALVLDRPDVASVAIRAVTPQTALEVEVQDTADRAEVYVSAIDALFAPGVIDDMVDALHAQLGRLSRDPCAWERRSAVAMPEHQRRTRAALETPPIAVDRTLCDLVRALPADLERTAISDAAARITYGDLDALTGKLAAALRRHVPGREPVAIAMRRGVEQMIAAVGCVRAGIPYVPLEGHWPLERIAKVIAAGGLEHAIVDRAVAIPDTVHAHAFDELVDDLAELPVAVAPTDLAYIIYTSGTTGEPKGVAIEHRSATNTILDILARFQITADDRVFSVSSLAFDLSVFDLFGMLAAGGECVVGGASADPRRWEADCARCTAWSSVPAFMVAFVDHLEATGSRWPEALRLVMLSGDWIPVDLPARIHALCPAVEVVSLGGATEAAIWSVYYRVRAGERFERSIPYGFPLAGQALHVVDEQGRVVPDFVAGNLCISGIGLARGYHRDPQRTQKRFYVHDELERRVYLTGDLARTRPDGALEFLGREDGQLKVQGYRIEQGEIEAAIRSTELVTECAVVGRSIGTHVGAEVQLVAHVVWQAEPADAELRRRLARTLPAYMIPHLVIAIPALPLTANGKVDRERLQLQPPSEAELRPRRARADARVLREAWQRALSVDAVFDDDHFFRLGGTSLSALRAVELARAAGLVIPLRWMMEFPVFDELWARLQEPIDRLVVWTRRQADSIVLHVHAPRMPEASYAQIGSRLPARVGELASLFAEPSSRSIADEVARCDRDFDTLGDRRIWVLGWSAATIWAHACARRLLGLGRDVAGVVLIDPPGVAPRALTDSDAFHLYVESVLLQHGAAPIDREELVALPPEHQIALATERLTAVGFDSAAVLFADRELQVRELQRLVAYAPAELRVPALCVLPASFARSPWSAAAHAQWQRSFAAFQTTTISIGDHYTIMENQPAAEIADAITAWLDEGDRCSYITRSSSEWRSSQPRWRSSPIARP